MKELKVIGNKMIYILGGAKTGYNLYKKLQSCAIDCELYYFQDEYASKKKQGKPIECFFNKDIKTIELKNIFLTSEKAFVNTKSVLQDNFPNHFYLRDKLNLPAISKKIKTNFIQEFDLNDYQFPIAAKPKESSSGKVDFKFKKINNQTELDSIMPVIEHVILQPYLEETDYDQVAIAGYFDSTSNSLIAVTQIAHYPKGISAYVIDQTNKFQDTIKQITQFLNEINYRGFIEFEFKYHRGKKELFIMDINPRTWGWFYYYLSAVKNLKEVLTENKNIDLSLKKAWVNPPRLAMANLKGEMKYPNIKDVLSNSICYEPMF